MKDPWEVERFNAQGGNQGLPQVAIIHSFYRAALPSGENETVLRQFNLLGEGGYDVTLISVSTDQLAYDKFYKIQAAKNVAFRTGLDPSEILGKINPDIIHIHNLFPNISSNWITKIQVPVVASLHNFRSICAAATLSREGHDCELCLVGSPLNGLRYGCYRDSRLATLPLTIRSMHGTSRDPVLSTAQLLLAPSETVYRVYKKIRPDHVETLMQPTLDRGPALHVTPSAPYLFVGRLTPEKGILELLEVWPEKVELQIAGDGPLEDKARAISETRGLTCTFLGRVSETSLIDILRGSKALVFPSTGREAAPLVYAEALSAGLPVIAVRGNSVADSVTSDGTGFIVEALEKSKLEAAFFQLEASGFALRMNAYMTYKSRYTTESWIQGITNIYSETVAKFRIRTHDNP